MSKDAKFRKRGYTLGTFNPRDLGPSLVLHLDARDDATLFQDSAGTTPAGIGDVVGLWQDKSGNGFDFSQATTASKPVRRADGLEFDGSNDFLQNTESISVVANYTAHLAFDALRSGPNEQFIFDSSSGRLVLAYEGTTSLDTGYFDGAWHLLAGSVLGKQLLLFSLNSAAGGEVFRDLSSLGTDTYSQKGISTRSAVGSNNGGTEQFSQAKIKEIIIYNTAQASAQYTQVQNYLAKKWGITL